MVDLQVFPGSAFSTWPVSANPFSAPASYELQLKRALFLTVFIGHDLIVAGTVFELKFA